MAELMQTERTYVKDLETCVKVGIQAIKRYEMKFTNTMKDNILMS